MRFYRLKTVEDIHKQMSLFNWLFESARQTEDINLYMMNKIKTFLQTFFLELCYSNMKYTKQNDPKKNTQCNLRIKFSSLNNSLKSLVILAMLCPRLRAQLEKDVYEQ